MLVSVTNLKTFGSITTAEYDDMLGMLLSGTIGQIEKAMGRKLSYAESTEYFDSDGSRYMIGVERFPINETETLKVYYDPSLAFAEDSLLVKDEDFIVDAARGIIELLYGRFASARRCIKVVYSGGFNEYDGTGDGAALPDDIMQAILTQANHYFKRRDELAMTGVSVGGQNVSISLGFEFLPLVKETIFKNARLVS